MRSEIFAYAARTSQGQRVGGTLRAPSADAALLDLRRRALFVTSLVRAEGLRSRRRGPSRETRRATFAFFRAFATLLRSGITIRGALAVAIERTSNRGLREALFAVLADVEQGAGLSTAMGRRPREFSPLFVAMIRAGEAGGVLDSVLDRIAANLEGEHALRRRLAAAVAYPAFVGLSAAALMVFLLVRIVPSFAVMFEKFNVALPAPTRALLALSAIVSSPVAWGIAGAGALVSAALAGRYLTVAEHRYGLEHLFLRLPVVGRVLRAVIVARIARMLGVLLRSGVGLLPALEILGPVAGSSVYSRALAGITDELRRGERLRVSMERTGLFDPLVTALASAGEESATLDAMFLSIAQYLEVEVDSALGLISATVEPALIVLLGFFVATIVASIFLPLYTLIGSVS